MATDEIAAIKGRQRECEKLFSQGDSEKMWKTIYKEGAYLMAPGVDTVTGKDAIKAMNDQFHRMGPGVPKMVLKSDEIRVKDDWAVDRGHFEMWKGDEQKDHGKYVALWEKIDGKWFVGIDCFNSNKPSM